MKRLRYSVLIVCLVMIWFLPACGNEEVTSETPAEKRYANQLEDKEITENPSQVLTPEEGNKGTVKGQLTEEQQAEEMMERDEEQRDESELAQKRGGERTW
jgi:hypothetical protein